MCEAIIYLDPSSLNEQETKEAFKKEGNPVLEFNKIGPRKACVTTENGFVYQYDGSALNPAFYLMNKA